VTRWQPCLELTRLLDALSEEIIAADDEEIRQLQGRTIAGTAREVRLLIEAARADREEGVRMELDDGLCEPGPAPRPAGMHRRPSHQQRH
jgi:hypothetical protein